VSPDPRGALAEAIRDDDTARARMLLQQHPELRAALNQPAPELAFGATPLIGAVQRQQRVMIDLMLQFDADIDARSDWWAGGFGVLDLCDPGLAPFLMERGATVDVHAAARLGMLERLREIVARDPTAARARGGDGQTPLHVAADVEVAAFLLEHGAELDALDVDHESTPAQYLVRGMPGVARFLIGRGCRTDLLMAAALGDHDLARRHLDADPGCIRMAVTRRWFPMRDPRAGGHIYIWALGGNRSPHRVAREFGHEEVLALLMERSPASLRLAASFEVGDVPLAEALLAADPGLVRALTDDERRRLADAAQDGRADVVRRMLAAGWPVDARGQHGGTALHWAAWHGDAALVGEILRHAPPLEAKDEDYDATPLGWALHASVHGWHPERGDYAGTVEALLRAGARAPEIPDDVDASDAVRAVLRR
jgi:hypothetical protein